MADLTVTATGVLPVSNSTNSEPGICGETITAGQSLYVFDSSTSPPTYKKADADSSVTTAAAVAISMGGGNTGQLIMVAKTGNYTAGATVVVGKPYYVSATAGGIAPAADLATGMFVTQIGVGISPTVIQLNIKAYGIATP